MDRTSNLSPGSCCLICCSAHTEGKANESIPTPDIDYDRVRLTKTTEKIFEYLFFPKERLEKAKNQQCMLFFCPHCSTIVNEIIELEKKVEGLELQIRWKVETLGRIASDKTNSDYDRNVQQGTWKTVNAPTTQNFNRELFNSSLELSKTNKLTKVDLTSNFEKPGEPKSAANSKSTEAAHDQDDFPSEQNNSLSNILVQVEEITANVDNILVNVVDSPFQSYDYVDDFNGEEPGEVTADSKIWVGRIDDEEGIEEEIARIFCDNQDSVADLNNADLNPLSEGNSDHNSSHKDVDISANDRDFDDGSIHVCDMSAAGSSNMEYTLEASTSDIVSRDPEMFQKELKGLIEGHDYIMCTKCEYFAKRTSTHNINNQNVLLNSLLNKVGDHYSTHHNPVNPTEQSKTIDGKDCYQCTNCSFYVKIKSNTASACHNSLRILSLHYMALHDVVDSHTNATSEISVFDLNAEEVLGVGNSPNQSQDIQLNEVEDEDIVKFQSSEATSIPQSNNDEFNVENKICVGDYYEEETDRPIIVSQEIITAEQYNAQEFFTDQDVINNTVEAAVSDKKIYKMIDSHKEIDILGSDSNRGSTDIGPERSTGQANNNNNSTQGSDEINKELEGLIEGQDYFKCTRCDFFAKRMSGSYNIKNCPSSLRAKVTEHYNKHHNPVNKRGMTTIDGKDSYRCTVCAFSVDIKSTTRSALTYCLRKLSLHYMEEHDVVENQSNPSLKEGSSDRLALENSQNGSPDIQLSGEVNNNVEFKSSGSTEYFQSNEMSSEEVTVESNVYMGDYYQEDEEIHPIVIERKECISAEQYSAGIFYADQDVPVKMESENYEIHTSCENLQPIRPKKRAITCINRKVEDLSSGNDLHKKISSNKESEISGSQRIFDSPSTNTRQKGRSSLSTGVPVIDTSSVERTNRPVSSTHGLGELNEEFEGLLEGRDYFKCTKCDFFAKKSSTHSCTQNFPCNLRRKVADHYSNYHNPVKPSDESKTIDGKDCYKCTKCTFSVLIKSKTRYTLGSQNAYCRKLSLHYMEVHDTAENQWNSNSNNEDINATSLTEGIDYFTCPVAHCTFQVFFKREESQIQQLKNATEARLKIIQHCRTSRAHFNNRKNILPDLTKMPKISSAKKEKFYQCKKCNFKSVLVNSKNNNISLGQPAEVARKVLKVHFLLEHVLQWEKFPGLYKYGCYEEKCQDGHFLKCPYSTCDYFLEVQYDLKGKTPDECLLGAYQSFMDNHAWNHNLNSIGFNINDPMSTKPVEEDFATETFPNVGNSEGIQLNEVKDSTSYHSSDFTINPEVSDMSSEEITIENIIWVGDYYEEEQEEIDPTVFEWQESTPAEVNDAGIFSAGQDASGQMQRKMLEIIKIESDIDTCFKILRPLGPKKRAQTDSDKKLDKSGSDSDFDSSSTHTRPKRRKVLSTRLANYVSLIERPIRSNLSIRGPHEVQKELKGLTEGRDYFKCTQCDFFAKRTSTNSAKQNLPSSLRAKVTTHYNINHNPVKPGNESKTVDGKNCYECTKCSFSVIFKSNTSSDRHFSRVKLASHYMELHDKNDQFSTNSVEKSVSAQNRSDKSGDQGVRKSSKRKVNDSVNFKSQASDSSKALHCTDSSAVREVETSKAQSDANSGSTRVLRPKRRKLRDDFIYFMSQSADYPTDSQCIDSSSGREIQSSAKAHRVANAGSNRALRSKRPKFNDNVSTGPRESNYSEKATRQTVVNTRGAEKIKKKGKKPEKLIEGLDYFKCSK